MKLTCTNVAAAVVLLAGAASAPDAHAVNSYLTNPLGFSYANVPVATAVDAYSQPSGMLITGRCNRYHAYFAAARADGAEILAYINPVERPDSSVCDLDDGFYNGDPATVPLWPYPTTNPGSRVNYPNNHLTDITVNSAWVDSVVDYVGDLMLEDEVDGVFLDVVGTRLWSTLANWDSWPAGERQAWTDGNVDLVRRIYAKRAELNRPNFIIVNNNIWVTSQVATAPQHPGEKYVDGICLEHPPAPSSPPNGSTFHMLTAGRQFGGGDAGGNGPHRRFLVIASQPNQVSPWTNTQGVTHVSNQNEANGGYGTPTAPPTAFHGLTDRQRVFGHGSITGSTPSSGMTADQKRGSKFTLPHKATLRSFTAWLDGIGAPPQSTQPVRMVLYRDSGGVPGARVAQSITVNVTSGFVGAWLNFPATATALDPGTYWIVIHTGPTGGVARNRGIAGGNWYSNADTFSDGPSNPFGTGTNGPTKLSVLVSYTVGY